MKRAKVFYSDILCGYLIEDEDGYTFYYTKEYLNLKICKPISLTMPLRQEPYHSIELLPFFDGLIPEGWLLYLTIKTYKIDRVIFYSLNPHKETIYANSSQPASLYYAEVVSRIRIEFPKIEIICGTWIDNLANIGILILSGANGITKFPLFKMFGTKYGKRVEEEVKFAGRKLKGTFTDKNQLGNPQSEIGPSLDKFIKRYIKESLKNKY